MGPRELDNRFSRARQALAECRRRNTQDSRRLDSVEFQNLTQDVGQTMGPIEARQKSVHAADLDFFEKQRLIWRPLAILSNLGQTVVQFAREPVKGIGLPPCRNASTSAWPASIWAAPAVQRRTTTSNIETANNYDERFMQNLARQVSSV